MIFLVHSHKTNSGTRLKNIGQCFFSLSIFDAHYCYASLAVSQVVTFSGISLNKYSHSKSFSPCWSLNSTLSLILMLLLKMRLLTCLGVYEQGFSCWSQHSVRTMVSEQKVHQSLLWPKKQHLPGRYLCASYSMNFLKLFSCQTLVLV